MPFGFNRLLGAGLLFISAPVAWRLLALPPNAAPTQLGLSRTDAFAVWLTFLLGLSLAAAPLENLRTHSARTLAIVTAGLFMLGMGSVQVIRAWSAEGGPDLMWLALGALAAAAGIAHLVFSPIARVLSLAYGWLFVIGMMVGLFAGNMLLAAIASIAVANPFGVPSGQATQVSIDTPPPQSVDALALCSMLLIPATVIWFYNRSWIREELGDA
ncbi:MAG: hypothetical protein A3B78_00870 [Omnitrophica WOR_2 bacterium RIFCSPHIGHO2_02_FULL_67_20]|nr:MAG: hypothetical protein A3B78_00870 [Omnitrophica WOR_2 bacterium RIFCSPHIGHO2_02_FULL_67_20]